MIKRFKRFGSESKHRILKHFFYSYGNRYFLPAAISSAESVLFQKYVEYIRKYKNIEYEINIVDIPRLSEPYKWVGGQIFGNILYGIPSGADAFLLYDTIKNNACFSETLEKGEFKWTGGCIWNEDLYAFPRSSNVMLKLNRRTGNIEKIVSSYNYSGEHHYGGICTSQGIVYQPPRDTDHILVWNLKTKISRKIQLSAPLLHMKLRYCGGIIHPNGFAYFFPERYGKIIKLDLKSEKWCLIGSEISTMVFDAKIAADGNIYGFSAYCPGILKIITKSDTAEMIHTEINPGAFGTKLGINGNLYSIPGDGQKVWEYNPYEDKIKVIYRIDDLTKAKYAGGVTLESGEIIAIAAAANNLCILRPKRKVDYIEKEIYDMFWKDNY